MSEHDKARQAADRIWLVLETLSAARPSLPFKDGVILAQGIYEQVDWARKAGVTSTPEPFPEDPTRDMPDFKDTAAFGRWLGAKKAVTDFLPDKKINAIKEARAATTVKDAAGNQVSAGLKEAKEAVEWLGANPEWIKYP